MKNLTWNIVEYVLNIIFNMNQYQNNTSQITDMIRYDFPIKYKNVIGQSSC
jgi:hypothetical protein